MPRELHDISSSALGGYGNDVDWKSTLLLLYPYYIHLEVQFTHFIRACLIYYALLLMQGTMKTNFQAFGQKKKKLLALGKAKFTIHHTFVLIPCLLTCLIL